MPVASALVDDEVKGAPVRIPEADGTLVRLIVGFHGPHSYKVGDSYLGEPVVMSNHAINFVVVETTRESAFRARAFLEADVQYVDVDRVIQWIVEPTEKGATLSFKDLPLDVVPDMGALLTPNDPRFAEQYGPQNIEAQDAWDVATGDMTSAVCVTDTGTRYTHEDLAGSRYLGGYDYINNDANPMDDNGHGTHVTSSAASGLNNAIGIAGVANVGYYAVKVLSASGSGSFAQVASGITWCADNTMDRTIISMSLGCNGGVGSGCDDTTMRNAVQYAVNTKGKVIVAAAGNSGPCTNCVGLPAAYPEVIAVGCTTRQRSVCSFSSRGPQVEISAPGAGILAAWHTSDTAYNSISGTSMSTPHVSGAMALAWGHLPTLTGPQLRTRLTDTAKDYGAAGRDIDFGYGEVGLACFLGNVSPCPVPPPPPCGNTPANNCFENATVVSSLPHSLGQSTSGADTENGEPLPCGSMGATAWFRWTADTSGRVAVTTNGSSFDTVAAAYTGSTLGGLTNLACNDDTFSLLAYIEFNAVAGTTYQIQIGGYSGASGTLSGAIHYVAAPPPSAPGTPTLTATAGNQMVGLSWTTPSAGSSPITGYNIYRGTTSGGETLLTSVGVQNSYNDNGLTNGVTYYYQVSAVNSVGEGARSAERSATPFAICEAVPNDCVANATTIAALPYSASQSTTGATMEPGEPGTSCVASVSKSVWWSWTANSATPVNVNTIGSSYDTVLDVRTGSGFGSPVACNDDSSGLQSNLTFTPTAGTTYLIRVTGYGSSNAGGSLVLNVGGGGTPPPPPGCSGGPANNCFENATVVTSTPATFTQSTSGATTETGEPAPCGSIGSTVWYRWTAASTGTMVIDTVNSTYDTVLAAYTGSSLGGLTLVACNDDIASGNLASRITINVTAGTTYQVQVGGYQGATGALALNFGGGGTPGTPPGAPALSATAGNSQVSLSWTTPSPGSSPITGYRIYRGTTPGGETLLASVGVTNGYTDTAVANGVTYYYQVSAMNSVGEGPRSNRVSATPTAAPTCPATPANNCFANAAPIVLPSGLPTTKNIVTTGATREAGEPLPSCQPFSGATVWYRYTPTAAGPVALHTRGSTYDTVVAVYTGTTLASLTEVTCSDDFDNGLSQTDKFSAATFVGQAGTTYWIQVSGFADATGNLALTLGGGTSPI